MYPGVFSLYSRISSRCTGRLLFHTSSFRPLPPEHNKRRLSSEFWCSISITFTCVVLIDILFLFTFLEYIYINKTIIYISTCFQRTELLRQSTIYLLFHTSKPLILHYIYKMRMILWLAWLLWGFYICIYNIYMVMVKSLSRVWLSATPWTVAYHAPPSMGFFRQEYWSGLPFPSPEDLPDQEIDHRSPAL